jgi:hypothetical protein
MEYPWVLSNENLIDLSFGWPLAGPGHTRQVYSNFLVLCNTKPQLEQEEGKKKKRISVCPAHVINDRAGKRERDKSRAVNE